MDQPEIDRQGFVAGRNDVATMTATLLWAGTSPLQPKAVEEGKRRGISVAIKPAKYSHLDVMAAVDEIAKAAASDPAWHGFTIVDASCPSAADFTSDRLTARGVFPGSVVAEDRPTHAVLLALARAATKRVSPEDVHVEVVTTIALSADGGPRDR